MKTLLSSLFLLAVFSLFTSCATICGGSKYFATVTVPDHPHARITYKGGQEGHGTAVFMVRRKDANKFSVAVKEDTCTEQVFKFSRRTFRGWAFAGTIVMWTGLIGNVPLPWGVVVDLSNGALWKPNIHEKGVSKINHKRFKYTLAYDTCKK